jgi:hypothetical protein
MNYIRTITVVSMLAGVLAALPQIVLADPPRAQGPTRSGESLDRVQAREAAQAQERRNLDQLRKRAAVTYNVSEEEVERQSQPPRPRAPQPEGKIYPRGDNVYGPAGNRFRPLGFSPFIPDPRKLGARR